MTPNPYRLNRRHWLAAAAGLLPLLARAELADIVERLRPSLVAVGTYRETDAPRFTFRGTGFAVGDGNTIVTNAHVLPPEPPDSATGAPIILMVAIPRQEGEPEPRRASLLASDRNHDLALLRIEGPPLPPVTLGGSALLREGSAVALLGFPIGGIFGFSPVVHRGIVSSRTRIALPAPSSRQLNAAAVARMRSGAFEVYQLDATAYPGNSGGPLVDTASGQVIGVVNMVLVRNTRESALTNPTGITYAIPIQRVHDLLQR